MENQTELSEIESNQESEVNTQNTQESFNSEPERIPEPWESAPDNMIYPEKINDNGRLGSYTLSAEMAYRLGTFENGIPLADVEFSDIDDWPYLKDKCPHKTQEMISKENAIKEIQQLKKQLSDTDYKAIKYAEGEINPEEYLPIKNQRAEWRAKINQLQAEFDI